MEKIGIDVHKVATQVCVLTETGEYEEQRIRTDRDALARSSPSGHELASCWRLPPRVSGWLAIWSHWATR